MSNLLLQFTEKRRKIINLFLKKLFSDRYIVLIKKYLKDYICKDNKSDIEKYAVLYVRVLTVYGYDSRYIFQCLNKIFYLKKVVSIKSLDEFFQCFDGKQKEYNVLFFARQEIAQFSEKIQSKSTLDKIKILSKNEIPKSLTKKNGFEILSVKEIEAYDEFSAFEIAKSMLNLLNNFYTYYRFIDKGFEEGGYVEFNTGEVKFIRKTISGVERVRKNNSYKNTFIFSTDLFDVATTNYDNLNKMSRIMQIHNAALDSKTQGNALLSLWSILELLLEENEDDNNHSRINKIINFTVPFLLNSYVEKLVKNLYNDVKGWNAEALSELLKYVQENGEEYEKFFAFLVLNKYEELRKKFYKGLSDYPLLRYRIYSLNKEISSTKNVRKKLYLHERKIKWHMQRIYRARNCIIHDGEDIENIDSLVENLLSYIDIICERIIAGISRNGGIYTVSNIILEEEIQYKMFEKEIQNYKMDESNYLKILYHNTLI